jgi:hypothetical protein
MFFYTKTNYLILQIERDLRTTVAADSNLDRDVNYAKHPSHCPQLEWIHHHHNWDAISNAG